MVKRLFYSFDPKWCYLLHISKPHNWCSYRRGQKAVYIYFILLKYRRTSEMMFFLIYNTFPHNIKHFCQLFKLERNGHCLAFPLYQSIIWLTNLLPVQNMVFGWGKNSCKLCEVFNIIDIHDMKCLPVFKTGVLKPLALALTWRKTLHRYFVNTVTC